MKTGVKFLKRPALLALSLAVCMVLPVCAYTGASQWAEEELKAAESYALIPGILADSDVSAPINRLEFAALSVKLYEAFGGVTGESTENPFTDTEDLEVIKAYHAGITTGTSETTFSPDELISREQAATMLTRVYTSTVEGAVLIYSSADKFADDADISDWARESVYFMYANDIIKGIGDNRFAPRNVTPEQESELYANSTREQALAISVRMYENLKPSDGRNTDESQNDEKDETKVDLLSYAPPINFGTEIDRYESEGSIMITLKDVTSDEYLAYAKLVEMKFPNSIYALDTPQQYAKKNTNGDMSMTLAWAGGDMSITIEKELGY